MSRWSRGGAYAAVFTVAMLLSVVAVLAWSSGRSQAQESSTAPPSSAVPGSSSAPSSSSAPATSSAPGSSSAPAAPTHPSVPAPRDLTGLSDARAAAVARDQVAFLLDVPDPRAVPARVLDERTAIKDLGGRRVLLESAGAAYVRSGTEWVAVDRTLRSVPGGGWSPSRVTTPLGIPGRAAGVVALGDDLDVRLEGARDVPGIAAGAGVVYPNALADTDAVVASSGSGVQIGWVLRSEQSPDAPAVDLGIGADRTLEPDGRGFRVLEGGKVIALVGAPAAWDADGKPVPVSLEPEGAGFAAQVKPPADAAYPIVVDPVIDTNNSNSAFESFSSSFDVCDLSGGVGNGTVGLSRSCGGDQPASSSTAELQLLSPGTSFVSRVDIGSAVADGSSGCGGMGIRSASGTEQGLYSAVGTGSIGARTYNELPCNSSGPAVKICVTSTCGSGGTPGNRVYAVGAFADMTGPSHPWAESGGLSFYGVALYREDTDRPTVTAQSASPIPWRKTGTAPVMGTGSDTGLGVKRLKALYGGTTVATGTDPCTGSMGSPCPATWNNRTLQQTLNADTATLPEGLVSLSIDAEDILGNTAATPLPTAKVGVDRSGPVITFANGGAITGTPMAGTAQKSLHIVIADGTPGGTDAQRRSGAASATVEVSKLDGSGYQQEASYAAAPGCGTDSCGIDQTFAIDATKYGPGQHTVRVTATDQVGNTSTNSITFIIDTTGPQITLSGSLYDARSTTLTRDEYRLQADVIDGVLPIRGAGTKDVQLFVTETVGGVPTERQLDGTSRTCKDVSCDRTFVTTVDTTKLAAGGLTFRVHATDALGNASDRTFTASRGTVTFDQTRWSGLEDFLQYDEVETGGGSSASVNLASGNLVWQQTALVNPGRGLSTFAQVTYNAQAGTGGYDELSQGWSLTLSGLTRVNEPLDLSTVATGTVRLIDGDGTQHPFTLSSDGTYFKPPPGVDLHLRRFSSDQQKAWAITRPDGVTFYYDSLGYQTYAEDRNGNALKYTYEIVPKIVGATCPLWPSATLNTINCRQRLVKVTDATGLAPSSLTGRDVTVAYASNTGRITSLTDHAARVTQFAYDATTGRLTTLTEASGSSAARSFGFGYEPSGTDRDLAWVTDPRGNTTQFTYTGGYGTLTAAGLVQDPLADRRVTTLQDRRTNAHTYAYSTATSGSDSWWTAALTDGRSKTYNYRMDRRGRPVRRTDPLLTAMTLAYDADNNLATLTEAAGTADEAVTRMEYNVNGRLIEKVDPVGNRTVLRYRDGDGYSPGATYTDNLHGFVSDLVRVETPKGSDTGDPNDFASRFELDARGNVTASIDATGGRSETYHLDWGLVDYEKDPVGNITSYHQYDPSGLPREVWDPKGGHTFYAYDPVGNVTAVADPRSQAFGGLSDAQKRYRTSLTYDAQDRLKTEEIPKLSTSGQFITRSYSYNANGGLLSATDGNTAVSSSAFDAMDNVTQTETSALPHAGETTNETEITKYAYDAEQNVLTETRPIGVASAQVDDSSTAYSYDDVGRSVAERRRSRTATTSKDLVTSYAYDRRDNIVGQSDPRANTTWSADPVVNATMASRQRYAFTYDKADRQTVRVEDPAGLQLTTRTDYDENDNVVRVRDARNKGAEFGPADPLTPDVAYETTYTYDGADRLLTRLRDGSKTEVVRRADGLVTEVRNPRYFTAERVSVGDFISKYGYDAAGDITSITQPRIASSASTYANAVRTVQFTRDEVGNATTVTDPRGKAFTNTYLDTGDLLTTTRPSAWRFTPGAGGDEVTLKDLNELGNDGGTPDTDPSDGGQSDGDFGTVSPQEQPDVLPRAGDVQMAYDNELRLTSVTELESPLVGGNRAVRTLARDALGRVGSLTTPYQRAQGGARATIVQKTAYDRNGNATRTTDGEGFTTYNSFDQFDRLIGVSTPASSTVAGAQPDTTQYRYDENSNVYNVQKPNGAAWMTWSCFDKADRLVASIDEELAVTRYRVDNVGQVIRQRSPRGTAQASASPSCTTYPMLDGGPKGDWDTDTRHDPNGWVTQVTDALGQTASYTYDRAGNTTASSEPGARSTTGGAIQPRVTTTSYDARDLPWVRSTGTTTAPNAKTTTLTEYDANRNLRRTMNASGLVSGLPRYPLSAPNTTSYASAADRLNTGVAQSTWRATLNEYDDDNLLVAVHLPWGNGANPADTSDKRYRQDFERDARGYVTAVRQANDWTAAPAVCAAAPATPVAGDCVKRSTYTLYDNGWIRTATGPDAQGAKAFYGERQIYDYDRRGLQTSWSTKTNRSATDDGEAGASRVTQRAYFPSGALRTRTTSPTPPATVARTLTYGYDANTQVTSLSDDSATAATTDDRLYVLGYDRAGRQTSHDEQWTATAPAPKDTQTTYDLAGNRTVQRTEGTLSGSTYSGGKLTTSAWDHLDREVTTTVTPSTNGGYPVQRWQRSFFPSGDPETVVETAQASSPATPSTRVSESKLFRDDGRQIQVNRVDGNNNSVMEPGPPIGGVPQSQGLPLNYTYDADGNRTEDESGRYEYDARAQLTKWTRPEYDANGIKTGIEDTAQYQLTSTGDIKQETDILGVAAPGTTVYTYIGDRLVGAESSTGAFKETTAYTYNMTSGANPASITEGTAQTNYSYDAYSRVASSTPVTSSGLGTSTTTTYDALDRRESQAGATTKSFSYEGAGEELSSQTTGSGSGATTRAFDYSAGGEPLGMSNTANFSYRSFALTANGSIGGLENAGGSTAPDAAGAPSNRYRYDPYGAAQSTKLTSSTPVGSDLETQLSGDAQANPLRFQGFMYDAAVKTYDMRARAYRPQVGRFQTADRLEDSAQDFALEADPLTQSRYAWAGGNPITNVEYDGHNILDKAKDTFDDVKDKGEDVAEEGAKQGKEFAEGGYDSVKETADAVTHPERTAKGMAHAATHPWETAKTIASSCKGRSAANCAGYVTGTVAGGKGAAGAAKAGAKAGAKTGAKAGAKGGAEAAGRTGSRSSKADVASDCTANSFAGDTPVVLADGTTAAISTLAIGDLVLATDPLTGETSPRAIERVIIGEGIKAMVRIVVGDTVIQATALHPFWVENRHAWIAATDLRPGDVLHTADGDPVTVASLTRYGFWGRVFNLTVQGIHTYYAGAERVLVHNCAKKAGGDSVGNVKRSPTGRGSVPKEQRDQRRLFTAKQKKQQHEDQNGRCAGCDKPLPLDKADAHHRERHADGGRTENNNNAMVCKSCHRKVHRRPERDGRD